MLGKNHVEVIVLALATGLGLDVYDDLVWVAGCQCVRASNFNVLTCVLACSIRVIISFGKHILFCSKFCFSLQDKKCASSLYAHNCSNPPQIYIHPVALFNWKMLRISSSTGTSQVTDVDSTSQSRPQETGWMRWPSLSLSTESGHSDHVQLN